MTDGDGNYGYRGADDSFVPFSSGVAKEITTIAFGSGWWLLNANEDGFYWSKQQYGGEVNLANTPFNAHMKATTVSSSYPSVYFTIQKSGYYAFDAYPQYHYWEPTYIASGTQISGAKSYVFFGETNPFE